MAVADLVSPRQHAADSKSPLSTACRRCRKQKLRCTREKPACKRCVNISALCSYPPPPNRKLLAAQRTRDARSRANHHPEFDAKVATPASEHEHVTDAASVHSEENSPAARDSSSGGYAFGAPENWDRERQPASAGSVPTSPTDGATSLVVMPPTNVGLFLIHMYFSHMYNSALLFHKQSLISDYLGGRVPSFVALSIFAITSTFLRNSPKHLRKNEAGTESEMLNLTTALCNRHAHQWASAASLHVLSQADEPRLETIQACQNLALYWFGVDQKDRTDIHSLLAYRTCRLLGFHIPSEKGTEMDEVYGELKRRCFWSCWITGCISQDNASFKGRSWQAALGLAFPSDEESFANERPVSNQAFNEEGQIASLDGSPLTPQPSVMGELVKLYSLWWEIQSFVNQQKLPPAGSRIATLSQLDRQLEMLVENLHPDLQYKSPMSFSTSKLDPYKLFFLHSFYHACCCVLHSSIVPVFSNTAKDNSVSKKLVKLSTKEAVVHSMIIIDMSTAFLRTNPDKARLPSMIGYAMFVSCTIHFRSLAAQGKLRAEGTGRLRAAISILESVKEIWRPNRGLWTQLETAFRSAGVNLNALSTASNRSSLTSGDSEIDVERIAAHDAASKSNDFSDIYRYVTHQEPKRVPAAVNQVVRPLNTAYSPKNTTSLSSHVPAASPPGARRASTDYSGRESSMPLRTPFTDPPVLHPTQQRGYEPGKELRTPNVATLAALPLRSGTVEEYEANMIRSSMIDPTGGAYDMMAIQMMGSGSGTDPGGGSTWWDQSFETINPDPMGYLLGGFPGGEGGAYFFPPAG